MFQSLLSWIGFKDAIWRAILRAGARCFNPCCRGLGSKTPYLDAVVSDAIVFQSLLSWIGFKDSKFEVWDDATIRFQSLLSWIGFKDDFAKHERPGRHCVSILVVVDWVQRPDAVWIFAKGRWKFQSLLSWIGFKDIMRLPVLWYLIRVSILVVVDWVQRQCCIRSLLLSIHVSILVVVDWVQRQQVEAVVNAWLDRFQSLLSWIGFKDAG